MLIVEMADCPASPEIKQTLMELTQKKLNKGYTPEEITDALETDISVIRRFMERIDAPAK